MNMKAKFLIPFEKSRIAFIIIVEVIIIFLFLGACLCNNKNDILTIFIVGLLSNILLLFAYGYWIKINNNEISLFYMGKQIKKYQIKEQTVTFAWMKKGMNRGPVLCFSDQKQIQNDVFSYGLSKKEKYIIVSVNCKKLEKILKILKVPVNLFLLETYQEHLGTYSKKQFFNMYHKILLHNKNS